MQTIQESLNHEQLSSVLDDLGYSYSFQKNDLCVVQLDDSTNMLIIFYGNNSEETGEAHSIKFRSAWSNANNLTSKAINAFNRKFRFVKAYLDHEGDPILEADYLVAGSSDVFLRNVIHKFTELVTTFETFMALAEDFDMNL